MGPGASIFIAGVTGLLGLILLALARSLAREADRIDLLNGDVYQEDLDQELTELLEAERDGE